MRRILCAALGACLPAVVVQAEPTPTVNWLMNESMSLFDWGIYKTDKKAAELKAMSTLFTTDFLSGSAEYERDANRIRVRVLFAGKGTEKECTENLKRAKGAFLNFKWIDKEQIAIAPSVLYGLFSHEGGYKAKATPKELGEELAKIATIESTVLVREAEGSSYVPKAKCRADFTSPEISVLKP